MDDRDDPIADFFAQRRIAVVGATPNTARFGYRIFRYLRERGGHEVFGVHPSAEAIDGVPLHRSLADIPAPEGGGPPVDAVNLVVNPSIGIDVVRQAADLGVKRIWAQPGAESREIAAFCRDRDLAYVEGCVLVEGPRQG